MTKNSPMLQTSMSSVGIVLCFIFLILSPTYAQDKNAKPQTKTTKTTKATKTTTKTTKATTKTTKATTKTTKSSVQAKSTSPYTFTNQFCISSSTDVPKTFCLKVLRSSPDSTKAKDNTTLLQITADSALDFGNKTIAFLKKLSEDNKVKPTLKPVIQECVSAYEGFIKQFKVLSQEIKGDLKVVNYDAELAKEEVNRCVKALRKNKHTDIDEKNRTAYNYIELSQKITDTIPQKK